MKILIISLKENGLFIKKYSDILKDIILKDIIPLIFYCSNPNQELIFLISNL